MGRDAGAVVDVAAIRARAHSIRSNVVRIAAGPHGAHVGGSMSIADVLAVLYFGVLRVRADEPAWPERDTFILSKGHASAALYATLAERGFFPADELATYGLAGSRLFGHPTRAVPGVEFPTGSLGHGLSLGVGTALAARRDGSDRRTFVLLGDGELQEGSVWEAAMAAGHFGLDNLVAIVDRNRLQINGPTERSIALEPLAARWESFGWSVRGVDGHDVGALADALGSVPWDAGSPSVLIASTVKGKGIGFAEGRKKSHYMTLTPALRERAERALSASGTGT